MRCARRIWLEELDEYDAFIAWRKFARARRVMWLTRARALELDTRWEYWLPISPTFADTQKDHTCVKKSLMFQIHVLKNLFLMKNGQNEPYFNRNRPKKLKIEP